MLNLVRLRDKAAYPDGRDATGREATRLTVARAAQCSAGSAAFSCGSAVRT